MDILLYLVVLLLTFLGGWLSGLFGVSGAVVTVPFLLYGPQILGIPPIDIKQVMAISLVQGLVSSFTGALVYKKSGLIDRTIVIWGGVLVAIGGLIGGILSKWSPDTLLLVIFGSMSTTAVILMLLNSGNGMEDNDNKSTNYKILAIFFPEGVMAGMVGVGGGFLTVPILNRLMKIPLRNAIASSLAMTFFAVLAGLLGKIITFQVPFILSLFAVAGGIPGAKLGTYVNSKLTLNNLRFGFVILLTVISIRIWFDVFTAIN